MNRIPAALQPLHHWLRSSIAARLLALCLGLLLIVQLASFSALREGLSRHARNGLPERLQVGERVLQSLLDQQAQALIAGARLLAADYGFREAVGSNDAETISSALANHGARIGASEVALLDPAFRLRAATGPHDAGLEPTLRHLSILAAAQGGASDVAVLHGRPSQLVLVPVKAPVIIGWVLMGFPLDGKLVDDIRSLSTINVTLLTQATPGADWKLSLSSLPAATANGLARQPWDVTPPSTPTRTATSMPSTTPPARLVSVMLDDAEIGTRVKRLTPGADRQGAAVIAVVSLSVDDAVRLPADLQMALAAITLIAFTVFVLGSIFTTRHVTTPLRALAVAAERLGAGDFSTPLPPTRLRDEIGDLTNAFEKMRVDVSDKQRQILKLAYWDPLTGLPNRTQFRDAVREAIVSATAKAGSLDNPATVSVIMLDLNRFKHVNDVLGYRFGDLVLAGVAERLTEHAVRDGDMVARLGGDEFAVLLRHGDPALALSVAQRIEAAFDLPLTLEEHTVDMGAGIGVACWPQAANDVDTLLSHAEVAMYAAKKRTSGALMYDPSIDAASAQTLSLLGELRHAVGADQLRLYLQPKLALDSGRVVGAEALVRWQHPVRGLVPPMQFIPFAEQTGFIRTLTLWVFEEAARHWTLLHRAGTRITLSVNLSTRDLLDQDLPQKFEALLVKHAVPAEAFCLEITESAIMDDPQRAQTTLDRLSARGFKLSIDDFGTGYSSLAYLKRLPVDELKIDKSFVLGMERDEDDRQIVRSTIDLAHNLGLSVVAEGVENAAAWNLLRELNCDEAQGFHMGRPMPVDDFISWAAGWATAHGTGPVVSRPTAPIVLH